MDTQYKLLKFNLNGRDVSCMTDVRLSLLDLLRDEFGLTSVKKGCEVGECGACTVILDGQAVNSCLVPALSLEGRRVLTVEGLAEDGALPPLQEAFARHGAVQCGFCTPGFLMSAKALLDENPHPGREEIRRAVAGNLCRCTGYEQIIEAIADVAGEKAP